MNDKDGGEIEMVDCAACGEPPLIVLLILPMGVKIKCIKCGLIMYGDDVNETKIAWNDAMKSKELVDAMITAESKDKPDATR